MSQEEINQETSNEEVVSTEQEGQEGQELKPEDIYSEVLKERFGTDEESLRQRIEEANKWSWVQDDPFAQKMISHYRNGGDITEFAKKVGRKWDELPPRDILFEYYKERYPAESADTINRIIDGKHGVLFAEEDSDVDPIDLAESKRMVADARAVTYILTLVHILAVAHRGRGIHRIEGAGRNLGLDVGRALCRTLL